MKSIQSHPTTHITTARPTIVSEVDTRSKAEHDQLKIRISQYLLEQKPYTRLVADSAFRLRYRKPCLQTYGSRNRSADKTCYGNDMKTHSVQPHTLTNKPKTYQTYTSALNFGKRMKIDQKDRWKRLERVLSKSVDFKGGVDQIATGYIEVDNSNEEKVLKRSIKEVAKTCGILYPKKEKGKVFEQHETGQKINLPNNVI